MQIIVFIGFIPIFCREKVGIIPTFGLNWRLGDGLKLTSPLRVGFRPTWDFRVKFRIGSIWIKASRKAQMLLQSVLLAMDSGMAICHKYIQIM